jgi:hypothetical protein
VLPLSAALAAGCSHSDPAGPSVLTKRAFDARYVTVVSGDTDLPVVGAQVSVGGKRWTTDDAGHVPLPVEAAGSVHIAAEGFLSRQTRLGQGRLTLWPVGPGRGPEYVRAIIYRSSAAGGAARRDVDQPLQRVEAARVVVLPSRAIVGDAEAMAAHRLAIAEINGATEGRVAFSLGGSTAGAVLFAVDIDPRLAWLAATYKRLQGHAIVGGHIAVASRSAARDARFLAHELGHALGLQHSAAPTDLMYFEALEGGATSFTPAERVTIRLLLQRASGNHYPDNDRGEMMAGLTAVDTAVD